MIPRTSSINKKTAIHGSRQHLIPPAELDKYIAMHLLAVRKVNTNTGQEEEYEPGSLTSKFNSISRHLRDRNYQVDIKTAHQFNHSRTVLTSKRKELKSTGLGNKSNKADIISESDMRALTAAKQLGIGK
jgi:hypothetical protein